MGIQGKLLRALSPLQVEGKGVEAEGTAQAKVWRQDHVTWLSKLKHIIR